MNLGFVGLNDGEGLVFRASDVCLNSTPPKTVSIAPLSSLFLSFFRPGSEERANVERRWVCAYLAPAGGPSGIAVLDKKMRSADLAFGRHAGDGAWS